MAGALIGARVAAGVLLVLSPGNAALTVVAVLLIGFCFGPIFPTALSIVTATFRRAPGTAASVVVAMGSLGGMLLPWIQGALLESRGPSSSVLLVAAGAVAMLALDLGRGLLKRLGYRVQGTGNREEGRAEEPAIPHSLC